VIEITPEYLLCYIRTHIPQQMGKHPQIDPDTGAFGVATPQPGEANTCALFKRSKLQYKGDFELTMSSPSVDRSVFSADSVTQTTPQICLGEPVKPGAEIALTTRALLAVTLLGAGMWYLLWRVALYFEAAR
jgi:hypothetical protein